MKQLEDYELHPDVGSISFQYSHPEPNGGWSRREFCVKAGDNPDFWLAERLMPGAERDGCLVGVFVCGDDTKHQSFEVEVRARGSIFKTRIFAETPEELAGALCSIGGGLMLAWPGSPSLTRWQQIKLVLRWYWERRPVIRRRSPLWRFD
jgi:hypothetical protein